MKTREFFGMVLAVALIALSIQAAPGDDAASEAAVEALLDRATAFRLPEVQKLPWKEFFGQINEPFMKRRDSFMEELRALPDTPEREAIIARMCQEFSEPESRRYHSLTGESVAIRNFPYARHYLSHLRFLPAHSAETKELLLQREREALKLFYEAYIEAYDFVVQKVDGVARQMAQRQWTCRGSDGKSMVGLRFVYADPREVVNDHSKKRLDEWRQVVRDLDAGVEALKRTGADRPHWPDFPPMNFNWTFQRDVHAHYPEQGWVFIGVSGLHTSGSVSDYMRTAFRNHTAEELSQVEVKSDRNWALFIRDPKQPEGMIRIDLLIVRTPRGYLFLNTGCNTSSGLDRDASWHLRREMIYAVIDALTASMAGDIAGETFEPLDAATGRHLALEAIDPATRAAGEFIELDPKGGERCECVLCATFADGDGKPIPGAKVLFPKLAIGALSAREATTGADGRATVRYTAPSEEELEKAGKKLHQQYIAATEERTGLKSDVVITVRSKTGTVELAAKYPAVPAAERFRNPIRLKLNLAEKQDDQPYDVVCRAVNPDGRLRLLGGEAGNEVKCKLRPGEEFTLAYFWAGESKMGDAVRETVVIEVPERDVQAETQFRVGIDLAIDQVAPKDAAPMYAFQMIPLNVFIKDQFHNKEETDFNLLELFQAFRITPGIRIVPIDYAGPVVPDTFSLKTLRAHLKYDAAGIPAWGWGWDENTLIHPHGSTDRDQWVLIRDGWQTPAEGLSVEYSFPGVHMALRGKYKFRFELITGDYDASDAGNEHVAGEDAMFQIVAYETFGDEISETVFLPAMESLGRLLIGAVGGFKFQLAKCMAEAAFELRQGNVLNSARAFGDVLRHQGRELAEKPGPLDLVPAKKLLGQTVILSTVVDFASDAWQRMRSGDPPAVFQDFSRTPAPKGRTARADGASAYQAMQGLVDGVSDSYLVILQRKGLAGVKATLDDGTVLQPLPDDPPEEPNPAWRIKTSDDYVVVGSHLDEPLNLELSGSGGGGHLILITPAGTTSYPYPSGKWERSVRVSGNGSASFGDAAAWPENVVSPPPPAGSEAAGDSRPGEKPPAAACEVRVTVFGATEYGPKRIASARVLARRPDQSIREAVSQPCDGQGIATLRLPAAGEYEILAVIDGYTPIARKIQLSENATEQFELILTPRP